MSETLAGRRGGDVEIGRVLDRLLEVVRANAPTLLIAGGVLVVLPTFIYGLLRILELIEAPGDSLLAAVRGAPGEALITGLLSVVYSAAAIQTALLHFAGRRATRAEAFGAGGRFFFPLLGVGLATSIVIAIGLIFLVVPGLILLTMWIVAGPARVAENVTVAEAIDRSDKLTDGHRWPVFGLILIGWTICLVASFVGGAAGELIDRTAGGAFATELVINPLVQLLGAILSSVGGAALFEELRIIKDGPNPDRLAEIFA